MNHAQIATVLLFYIHILSSMKLTEAYLGCPDYMPSTDQTWSCLEWAKLLYDVYLDCALGTIFIKHVTFLNFPCQKIHLKFKKWYILKILIYFHKILLKISFFKNTTCSFALGRILSTLTWKEVGLISSEIYGSVNMLGLGF